MISEAHVLTDRSTDYTRKLCRHFRHKVPTELTEERGTIQFPMGSCTLLAEPETLVLRVEAEDEASLSRLEEVIESHLLRFSQPEILQVRWSSREQAQA